MKFIVDDKIPFLKGVLEPFVDVEYVPGKEISGESVRDSSALIVRTRTRCDAELLDGSNVKFIASATIGFDHIDTEYCKKQNIKWTNAPGCNSESVKQWVLSGLMHLAKNKIDLTERTLGVVGVGNVGKKMVQMAEAMGMRVLLNDPPREKKEGRCEFVSIEAIKRECDIISFHVPLTDMGAHKTYHFVDDKFIKDLNKDCVLINSSRGEVIKTSSLLEGLKYEMVSGALLDVWENEPEVNRNLVAAAEIATPHIAGYSLDGKAKGTAMAVQAISKFFGFPLDDWFPEDLILEQMGRISIDAENKTFQVVLTEIAEKTYQIANDDRDLRANIKNFEKLRGSYGVRREPQNWLINLKNDKCNYAENLRKLGFRLNSV